MHREGRLIQTGLRTLELGRLDQRRAEAPHTTWPMADEELTEWAANMDIPTPGELDGSEPIDRPPVGFVTWEEWRKHRWSLSVS